MKAECREYAEKVLAHIFIGSQLDGIKFGLGPTALLIRFEHYGNHSPDHFGLILSQNGGYILKTTMIFRIPRMK